jgi:hypothetical protein
VDISPIPTAAVDRVEVLLDGASAIYNAGPERVAKAGAIPKIPATRRYVDAVIECFLALSAGRTVRKARDCRRPQQ